MTGGKGYINVDWDGAGASAAVKYVVDLTGVTTLKVMRDTTTASDFAVPSYATMEIAAGKTLTVGAGKKVVVNGAVTGNALVNSGAVGVGVDTATGANLPGMTASVTVASLTNNGAAYVGGALTPTALTQDTDGQIAVNGGVVTIGGVKLFDVANDAYMEMTGAYATTSDTGYVGDISVTIGENATFANTAAGGDLIVIDARNNPLVNSVFVTGMTGNAVVITATNTYTACSDASFSLTTNPKA